MNKITTTMLALVLVSSTAQAKITAERQDCITTRNAVLKTLSEAAINPNTSSTAIAAIEAIPEAAAMCIGKEDKPVKEDR